jgi:hypothetical protein
MGKMLLCILIAVGRDLDKLMLVCALNNVFHHCQIVDLCVYFRHAPARQRIAARYLLWHAVTRLFAS